MISLEDAVINVAINNPSEILTVEKQATNFNFHELQNFGASARPQKILLHPVSCLWSISCALLNLLLIPLHIFHQ